MIKSISEKMNNDPRFKKYFISIALLVLAFLIIFAFFYIRDYGGQEFVFDGEVFQLAKVSSKQITLRDTGGEELVFTRGDMITLVAEYKGNTVRYGGGYGGLTGIGYLFSDGTTVTAYPSPDLTDLQRSEVQLITALRDYFDNVSLKYKHPFYYVILLIIVIAIAVMSMYVIVYPEEYWEKNIARRLFVHGGEPTDFALFMSEIGGAVAIAASILIYLSLIVR